MLALWEPISFPIKFLGGAVAWMLCMALTAWAWMYVARLLRRFGLPFLRMALKSGVTTGLVVMTVGVFIFFAVAWPVLHWLGDFLGL